jgi:magnesium transporter
MIPTPVFDPLHNSFAVDRGSMLMGDNYLLLFQETGRGFSDVIHDRLRAGKLRAQDYGVDYLLYLLLRAGIDQVGQLIDIELKNRFEALEDEVIASEGDDDCLDKLLAEREHVKALYEPLRRLDMFLKTVREGDVPFITAQTEPLFINNLKNDFERLEDGYTRLLEWWSQLLDLHRANVSESTDKIMNMLTIVSTIFLPITFITGFYGMNFINMPGVDNPYGFYIALLVMTASVLLTIIYMWKKGYFS